MIDQSTLPPVANIFPHRFKNFKNIRIFQAIQKICYSIGKFADLNVVVDYLLEVFLSSSVHRKEVVLFLNDILCCRIEIEIKGINLFEVALSLLKLHIMSGQVPL